MREWIDAYLGLSYRRRRIDADLAAVAHHFHGRVLDVGGARRRGRFQPPVGVRWVVVDLDGDCDVRADITVLPFRPSAFDAIKATEVLEHVPDAAAALAECARVLEAGGHLVLTAPFLERIHADPGDYARFTETMWNRLLDEAALKPVRIIPQGGYFTHLAGLLRFLVQQAPAGLRHLGYLLFPVLDVLAGLDALPRVRRSPLSAFVGGYLVVARR
jgi:SAM-dependent methyltransferase